jgi:hypothetical protein
MPDMFVNRSGFNFGVKQQTNEKVDDVVLPPWACNSPERFV